MPDKLKKTIIGAVIAIALALAVSYGLIGQQTANQIQAQANQTLQTGQTSSGQGIPPATPGQPAPAPQTAGPATQSGAVPQSPAPVPRQ